MHENVALDERFWSKVNITSECWLWTAGVGWGGYGRFSYRGEPQHAHVLSYCAVNGEPLNNVLHTCDVAACVNPAHLYDGTQGQNVLDCRNRSRSPQHIITLAQAREIKTRLVNGEKVGELAVLFGVSKQTVSAIKHGQRWAEIA